MNTVYYFIFSLFIFLLYGCSGAGNLLDQDELLEKLNLSSFPEQSNYPEADGIILLKETNIIMKIGEKSLYTTEKVHIVKKLFKNIENYAEVEIPLYLEEELKNIKGRTIKNDGTVIEIKEEDFYTIKGEGGSDIFYTDQEKIKFTYPGLEKNCMVELYYEKLKKRPFVNDIWFIQDQLPILRNTYELNLPRILLITKNDGGYGWSWNYKTYNFLLDPPEVTEPILNKQKTTYDQELNYKWVVNNVKGFEFEKSMPPARNYLSYVKFAPSEWKSWNDITEEYHKDYFKPQCIVDEKMETFAAELTSKCSSEEEKITNLYDHVKNIRYVAIELGIGSIKPNTPQTVLDRGYGDCKDKSNLLIGLLKSIGLKAYPVLVLTADEGYIDRDFPNWNFNHMIVKTVTSEGKSFFLDPTAKYSCLGELPYNCQGIDAVVIDDEGKAKIENISSAYPVNNTEEVSVNINFNSKNSAAFETEIKYYGQSNSYYRYELEDKTENEMKDYCKSLISDIFPHSEIIKYELNDINGNKSGLCLKFQFNAENSIQNQGDLYFFNIDPFKIFESTSWLDKDERNYPIKFNFPFTVQKKIVFNLPENYSIRNLPGNLSEFSEEFLFKKEYLNIDNRKIELNEKFQLKKSEIAAKKYKSAKEFFTTLKTKNEEKIILTKK